MKKILLLLLLIVIAVIGFVGFKTWKAMQGVPAGGLESTYMISADRLLPVDGATLRIREEGPQDAPVIILIHGFTFSLESFDGWAAELSKSWRVVRYDLLGHGLTGPDPQKRYAPAERAAFLGKVMDALEIDSAVIGGNSLGGQVAWRFAAANPDRVEKLILIDAAAFSINGVADEPVEAPAAMKAFLLTVPDAGVEATFNLVYADPTKANTQRKQLFSDMLRREGNGMAMIEHLEEFTLPAPDAELAKLTMPVLIQWGALDRMIPVDHAHRLDALIPDSTLIIYDDLGHSPQEEDPARTVRDAVAFIGPQE